MKVRKRELNTVEVKETKSGDWDGRESADLLNFCLYFVVTVTQSFMHLNKDFCH